MASLTVLNEMLLKAATQIDTAMKTIAKEKRSFASPVMRRLGAAQVEVFEAQYQIWALDPSLLPDVLKGPADDPSRALKVAMNRVRAALDNNAPEVARGVLDIFIAHQVSPKPLERARKERARLSK